MFLKFCRFVLLSLFVAGISYAAEPLSLWNDSVSRTAILKFVQRTTTSGSPDFLPVEQRIAVFDNDGTLWSEQPLPWQAFFMLDRIKAMAPQHPEWSTEEPFASVLKGDYKKALSEGEEALVKMMVATHAGQSTDQLHSNVNDWLRTAEHLTLKRHYDELIYAPMLEVLDYLRAHGYKVYIVSGGGLEFMRSFAERVYGVPPEHVIGSTLKTHYDVSNGAPQIEILPKIDLIDDGAGKPVGIEEFIGRKPVIAFGNSDGDFQMLEYTTSGSGPHMAFIVHHTDADREFAYDRNTDSGKLDKALDAAPARGWILIDMKKDWKKVYPFQPVTK